MLNEYSTFNIRETSQQGNLELENISTWNSSFQIFINTLDNILVQIINIIYYKHDNYGLFGFAQILGSKG